MTGFFPLLILKKGYFRASFFREQLKEVFLGLEN